MQFKGVNREICTLFLSLLDNSLDNFCKCLFLNIRNILIFNIYMNDCSTPYGITLYF
jgi:hypothetical protein